MKSQYYYMAATILKNIKSGNSIYRKELLYEDTSEFLEKYPTLNEAIVDVNNWMPYRYRDNSHMSQMNYIRGAIEKGLCYSLNELFYNHIKNVHNPVEEFKSYDPIWNELTFSGTSDASSHGLGIGVGYIMESKEGKQSEWILHNFGGYEYQDSLFVYPFKCSSSEWLDDRILGSKIFDMLERFDVDIINGNGIKPIE